MNYYFQTRDWFINLRLHDLSQDFQTDVGYVTRTGITRLRAGIMRRLYPESKIFLRIDPLLNNQFIWDKASLQWENNNAGYLTFLLPRSSNLRVGYAFATEIFNNEKLNISNFSLIGNSQFTKQLYLELTYIYGNKIRYQVDPYQGTGSTAEAGLVFQPSDNFNSSLSLSYSDLYRDDNKDKVFDYTVLWSRNTYQLNKYL